MPLRIQNRSSGGEAASECFSGGLERIRRKGVEEDTERAQLLDDLIKRKRVAGKMQHLLDGN